jgi:hypothetical protein
MIPIPGCSCKGIPNLIFLWLWSAISYYSGSGCGKEDSWARQAINWIFHQVHQ